MERLKKIFSLVLIFLFVVQPFYPLAESYGYFNASVEKQPHQTQAAFKGNSLLPIHLPKIELKTSSLDMKQSIESRNEILPINKEPLIQIDQALDSISQVKNKEITRAIGRMPVQFIENRGQVDERVRYYAKQGGTTIWFTDNEIVFDVVKNKGPDNKALATNSDNPFKVKSLRLGKDSIQEERKFERQVVKMRLKDTSLNPKIIGREKQQGIVNYFIGNDPSKWKTNIPTYGEVYYADIYAGIDLRFYANGVDLEYDFIVHPGANPEKILVAFEGADRMLVDNNGELIIKTAFGDLRQKVPNIYQAVDGRNVKVDGGFKIQDSNNKPAMQNAQLSYGFQIASYSKEHTLIIDPILASTYFADVNIKSTAGDSNGNVYVMGSTSSSGFPSTTGAYDNSYNNGNDVFVSEFDSNLSTLIASTFLGGSGEDYGLSIAIKSSGSVYIAGYTRSLDFPTTDGAYDRTPPYHGTSDSICKVFVSKLDNDLSTLIASTLIGGTQDTSFHDDCISIVIDSLTGDLFLMVGDVYSYNYPSTPNAYKTYKSGRDNNVAVSKFSSDLSTLMASTFLGYDVSGESLAIDADGHIFVAGENMSSSFPTTDGAYDRSYNDRDVFISKFSNDLSTLMASTFLGGNLDDDNDWLTIGIDPDGHVVVAGNTDSSDFPTTDGAYNRSYNGYSMPYVSKLSNDLKTLHASTFLDGNYYFTTHSSMVLSASGKVYVVGSYGEGVLISKLENNLGTLLATKTLVNGWGDYSIALTNGGDVTITGKTSSIDFPLTEGAYDISAYCPYFSKSFISTITADLSGGGALTPPIVTANLSGYLYNAVTGKPFSGITVKVDGIFESVTDSDGYYHISGLSCGTHTVTAHVPGYPNYARTIDTNMSDYLYIPITKNETVYGPQTPSGYSKDPVNTATGNYIYSKKDLEIPGRGTPISFERNYNSQDSVDSPLGFGWTHSYNAKLTVNSDLTVTIRWGDGKTETWTPDGYGGYWRQYGVFDDLIDNGDGMFTLKKKNQTRYNFDSLGRLSSIVDKNANAINLSYTGSNLTQITDTVSRNINLTYDGNSRIILITDPIGRTIQFFYDVFGNLASSTDMNGNVTNYTYDENHQMLTVVDARGNTVVTNTYDDQKRVVTCQKDAKQGQTTYTYDELNKRTTIVDQLGNTTIHYHDDLLRLIQETDALGNSAYYGYDWAGNRAWVTDRRGNVTQYGYDYNGNVDYKVDALWNDTHINYDANNNPLTRQDALWNTTSFEYDANGNLTKTTDPLGNFTIVTYDTNGQPITITDARGNTSTYAYDAEGNVVESVDALGNKTTYTYDGVGRRLTVKDALNRTTTYTYDNNNLLKVTDPLGGVNSYTYDGNNNKISVTDPMGSATSYAYDVKDLLTMVTDSLGNTINYTYDALDRKTSVKDKRGNNTTYAHDAVGNLTSVTDPLGNTTIYMYDANGNRLTETNPLGQTTVYAYDALNRVTSVADPLGNITANIYDAMGRVIATTNAIAQTTGFQYDAMGRLTTVTDSNGGAVTYTHDANGNRLTMTDPNGNTTSYAYDALNRLTQKVEPLGSAYQYSYDALGNRISHTDAIGNTIGYTFDANKRLSGISYPDSSAVTFAYDANGNKTQMLDSLGTSIYTYDQLNRLKNYQDPFGKTVGYGYDANGNRTSIIYPDGKVVNYSYDSLNRLVSVTDWLTRTTAYTYDTTGKLIGTSNPNGTTSAYSYDSAGRMIGLSNAKSDTALISSYSFSLDGIGNHTGAAFNEPLMPIFANKNVIYTYDVENRLTNTGSTANIFDVNGNMTASGSDTFTYDYSNRLTQSNIDGVIAQYSYDGLGNRLMKTENGVSTQYILDINGRLSNVLAETNGSPNIAAYYVYGLGLISKILPDGTAFYYHYDSRGSTVALTDANQDITDAYSYNSFGTLASSSGSTMNPFKYVGKYGVIDEGNGLDYIRARYYAPELGRFITKDPLIGKDRDSQSLNRYVYALNNPLRLIDISGLSPQEGQVSNKHEWSSDEAHERYLHSVDDWRKLAEEAAKESNNYLKVIERIRLIAKVTNVLTDFLFAYISSYPNPAQIVGVLYKIGDKVVETFLPMILSPNKITAKDIYEQTISLFITLVEESLKDKVAPGIESAILSEFSEVNQQINQTVFDEIKNK